MTVMVDGVIVNSGQNSKTVAITTAGPNELIVLVASSSDTAPSGITSSSNGLTYTPRKTFSNTTIYSAPMPAAGTETVVVNFGGSPHRPNVMALAFAGGGILPVWDGNAALPATANSASASAIVGSTSASSGILLAASVGYQVGNTSGGDVGLDTAWIDQADTNDLELSYSMWQTVGLKSFSSALTLTSETIIDSTPTSGYGTIYLDAITAGASPVIGTTAQNLALIQQAALGLGFPPEPLDTYPFTGNPRGEIELLYLAYEGRAGEPTGVAGWLAELALPTPLPTVAYNFASSVETYSIHYTMMAAAVLTPLSISRTVTSTSTIGLYINAIYNSLFGRNAEPAAYLYWGNPISLAIGTGNATTARNAIYMAPYNIFLGAQSGDQIALSARVSVADYFTTIEAAFNAPYTTAVAAFNKYIMPTVTQPITVESITVADAAILAFFEPGVIETNAITQRLGSIVEALTGTVTPASGTEAGPIAQKLALVRQAASGTITGGPQGIVAMQLKSLNQMVVGAQLSADTSFTSYWTIT